MFKFMFFSSIGPIALTLTMSDYGLSTASTVVYKDCGFGEVSPNPEFQVKADAFKKKYGHRAKVEWIKEANCQGVSLHYIPDANW